jgi:hypothetical protein
MYYRRYGDIGYVYRLGRLHAAPANSRMQGCVCVCVFVVGGGEQFGSQQRFAKRKAKAKRSDVRLFTWSYLGSHGNAPAEGEKRGESALLVRLP